MSTNPPVVLHEYKHQYPRRSKESQQHRPRIPPIPDLRFELSYLRSIQPFVHFQRRPLASTAPAAKESEKETERGENVEDTEAIEADEPPAAQSEEIVVEWRHVFWITARDQVISPLLQGALWAIISFYVAPFSARFAHSLVEHLPSRLRPRRAAYR